MIYLILFYEFFKIGLFAIGGGAVTIPFLFDLSGQYGWFSTTELADMIAVAESTPGPIGVNMATFAGYRAAGMGGGIIATFGLVLPSLLIILMIAKLLKKWSCNPNVRLLLMSVRPAVLALILFACWQIAKISIIDPRTAAIFVFVLLLSHFYKKGPIIYILLSALIGIILHL
jgi:chromate transporter